MELINKIRIDLTSLLKNVNFVFQEYYYGETIEYQLKEIPDECAVNIIPPNGPYPGVYLIVNGLFENEYFKMLEALMHQFINEIEANLKLIKEKKNIAKYLGSIFSEFECIDNSIKENKKNQSIIYSRENVTVKKKLEFYKVDELEQEHTLSDFFYKQKQFIREILVFIDNRKFELNIETRSRKKHVPNSFTLINQKAQLPLLQDVIYGLKKSQFIDESTSFKQFEKIFCGKKIDEPIKWIGDFGDLRSFIKYLNDYGCIEDLKKSIWEVTLKCFVDKNGTPFIKLKLVGAKKTIKDDSIRRIAKNLKI